jgi:hypothetical protein
MQKFFFDMKDGVPNRDRVGIEFKTNAEAITHCKEMAEDFHDNSLRDDQDLEILVINEVGRERFIASLFTANRSRPASVRRADRDPPL